MLILARNYGQLGNRLFLASRLIATARQLGVPFLNPSFAEYADLFPSTRHDAWCRYDPADANRHATVNHVASWKRKAIYRGIDATSRIVSSVTRMGPVHAIRLRRGESLDLTTGEFADLARSGKRVLISGWHLRTGRWLHDHIDAIRRHFAIDQDRQHRIKKRIETAKANAKYLVGVHVRRGDYERFAGGRFFFGIDQYAEAMHVMKSRLGGDVRFLVAGNTPLRKEDFGGLPVQLAGGDLIDDLYSLARCDAIAGPPSTFSEWASYYGNTPLHRMVRDASHVAPFSDSSLDPMPEPIVVQE